MAIIREILDGTSGSFDNRSFGEVLRDVQQRKAQARLLEKRQKKQQILIDGLRETNQLRNEADRLRLSADKLTHAENLLGGGVGSVVKNIEQTIASGEKNIGGFMERTGREMQKPEKPILGPNPLSKFIDRGRALVGQDLIEMGRPIREIGEAGILNSQGSTDKYTETGRTKKYEHDVAQYRPVVDKYINNKNKLGNEDKAFKSLSEKERAALLKYATETGKFAEEMDAVYKGTDIAAIGGDIYGEILKYAIISDAIGTSALPGKITSVIESSKTLSKLPKSTQIGLRLLGQGLATTGGNWMETEIGFRGEEIEGMSKADARVMDAAAGLTMPVVGDGVSRAISYMRAAKTKPARILIARHFMNLADEVADKEKLLKELMDSGTINKTEADRLFDDMIPNEQLKRATSLIEVQRGVEVVEPMPGQIQRALPAAGETQHGGVMLDSKKPTGKVDVGTLENKLREIHIKADEAAQKADPGYDMSDFSNTKGQKIYDEMFEKLGGRKLQIEIGNLKKSLSQPTGAKPTGKVDVGNVGFSDSLHSNKNIMNSPFGRGKKFLADDSGNPLASASFTSNGSNGINIESIEALDGGRKGSGTKLLKEIIRSADESGTTLRLNASNDFKFRSQGGVKEGMSNKQLESWYKKFGFVKDTEYSGTGNMVRKPLSQPTGAKVKAELPQNTRYGYANAELLKNTEKIDTKKARAVIDKIIKSTDESKDAVEQLVRVSTVKPSWFVENVVNKIPGKHRLFRGTSFGKTVVRSTGEAGQELAARMDVQELLKARLLGEGESLINELRDMGIKKKDQLAKVVDEITSAKTPESRKALTGAAKKIVDLMDSRTEAMRALGIDIGQREGYFKRMIKPGMKDEARKYIEESVTDRINKAIAAGDEKILKEYKLTTASTQRDIIDAARKAADGNIEAINVLRNRKGQIRSGIEYSRGVKLPDRFYEDDPRIILASWNNETANRMAASKVFGSKDERLTSLLMGIDREAPGWGKSYASHLMELQRMGSARVEGWTPAMQGIRSWQMIAKMPLSSITNITQINNKYTAFGLKKTAMAYAKLATKTGRKELLQKAAERGIGLTPMTDNLLESVYSGGKKSKLATVGEVELTINGFKGIEMAHRLADIELADDILKKMQKKGLDSKFSKRMFDALEINQKEFIKQGLTDDNIALFTRNMVDSIDFMVSPKDIVKWANSGELGKTVSQLGKFGMKQTKFYRDFIGKAVINGDFAPLVRWLVGANVIGAGAIEAKNIFRGKERENTLGEAVDSVKGAAEAVMSGDLEGALEKSEAARKYSSENISNAGGYGYLADVVGGIEYAKSPQEAIVKLFGPSASDGWNMVDAGKLTYDAFVNDGDKDKAIRGWLKLAPAGSIISNRLYPYDPKGGEIYDLNKQLKKEGEEITGKTISRDTTNEFGKAVRNGEDVSNSPIVKQLANKLYDEDGKEKLISPKAKEAILKFLNKYGVSDPRSIAIKNEIESEKGSFEREKIKYNASAEEKNILNNFQSEKSATKYLKSIGKNINDYPKLLEYYKSKE